MRGTSYRLSSDAAEWRTTLIGWRCGIARWCPTPAVWNRALPARVTPSPGGKIPAMRKWSDGSEVTFLLSGSSASVFLLCRYSVWYSPCWCTARYSRRKSTMNNPRCCEGVLKMSPMLSFHVLVGLPHIQPTGWRTIFMLTWNCKAEFSLFSPRKDQCLFYLLSTLNHEWSSRPRAAFVLTQWAISACIMWLQHVHRASGLWQEE